jgi:hypothetical protein
LPDFLHLVDKLGQALLSQTVGNLQLAEQGLALRIALPSPSHQVAQELYIGAHLPQLVAQMPVAQRVRHLAAGLEKTRVKKKTSPVGFFFVFLGYFGFFRFFYIFAQKREFLGFFQFQEHF